VANPIGPVDTYMTGVFYNCGVYSNERYDELAALVLAEIDPVKRAPILKELNMIRRLDVMQIPTVAFPECIYWWPWLKNYYGETNVQDIGHQALMAYVWIDENLKAEMGY